MLILRIPVPDREIKPAGAAGQLIGDGRSCSDGRIGLPHGEAGPWSGRGPKIELI